MTDVTISMELSLDSDKFLRRECPECEQEFKIQILEDEPDAPIPGGNAAGEMTCPYCGHCSGVERWWTPAQIAYQEALAVDHAAGIFGQMFDDAFSGLKSSRHVKVTHHRSDRPKPVAPVEQDDMRRVCISCCERDIKVVESWSGAVHCAGCGQIVE